jgi:hypothetical protein
MPHDDDVTVDVVDIAFTFNFFFGATTHHCSKALIDAGFELVIHNRIIDHYHEAVSFLKKVIATEGNTSYCYAHWTYRLACYLKEDISIKTAAYQWSDWKLWLQANVAMLEKTALDPHDKSHKDEAQKFLSAWHALVSDYHEDVVKRWPE